MKLFKYLLLAIIIALPLNVFAGSDSQLPNTDLLFDGNPESSTQLSSYYDLRDRETHVQVTNFSSAPIVIHVQIFQHDRGCDELNFFDDLTANDTVIYNMDNILKNDGSAAPISLLDDSYGYVVVSVTTPGSTDIPSTPALIGNFRIIDGSGYEYRANMVAPMRSGDINISESGRPLIANFNTVDGAMYADVVGYAYEGESLSTVTNIDEGFSFDIFTFDLDEEPLSCDRINFACGNVMNYGINEDYMASRGNNILCPGGGLSNPKGGFISFENGANLDFDGTNEDSDGDDNFVGFIGLNNNDGTGSLDSWSYSYFD